MSKSISKAQLVKKEYDEGYFYGYHDKTSVTRRFDLGFDSILEEILGEAYDEGYAHGISDREVSEEIDNITYELPEMKAMKTLVDELTLNWTDLRR